MKRIDIQSRKETLNYFFVSHKTLYEKKKVIMSNFFFLKKNFFFKIKNKTNSFFEVCLGTAVFVYIVLFCFFWKKKSLERVME